MAGLFRASIAPAGTSTEVAQQVGGDLGRAFFGDEVAGRPHLAADLRGALRLPHLLAAPLESIEPWHGVSSFAAAILPAR